jgi:hypothetical protein
MNHAEDDLFSDPELTRRKLVARGAEGLADVHELERRLTSDTEEIQKHFKRKLATFRNKQRVVFGREVYDVAADLEGMLEDLKSAAIDPRSGVKLMVGFFKSDKYIFDHCDDSSGAIGDVFRIDACDTFVHFARQCDDKEWLCDIILELNTDDGYGVRDLLFDHVAKFLPEDAVRALIDRLWGMVKSDGNRTWYYAIETIAKQLKDAPLFEKARLASCPEVPIASYIDIARVYLDAGDHQTSISWIEKVSANEGFMANERRKLALEAYKKAGNQEKANEMAWDIFRNSRSSENFQQLLSVVGEDKKNEIISNETKKILGEKDFSGSNAVFLIESGKPDDAEGYVLGRAGQINGDLYTSVLPLAEMFEENDRFLAASALYRALLESILARAQSKYYHHGVRYLRKLDLLAQKVSSWKLIPPHADYFNQLVQEHGRKTSFWSRYDGKLSSTR